MRIKKYLMTTGIIFLSVWTSLMNCQNVGAVEDVGKSVAELTSGEGCRGDTIEVKVKLVSNPGTIMSECRFGYDDSIVTVTDVKSMDIFACEASEGMNSEYIEPNRECNPLKIIDGYSVATANTTNTGDMYVIQLKIKDDAAIGKSKIHFSGIMLDWQLNEYVLACDDAEINVLCDEIINETVTGDTNGDGEADIADALLISQYDAGLIILKGKQLIVSDVNEDGETDIADALLISQYDAGIITIFKERN